MYQNGKKNLIAVIYKAPKMSAFEFVDSLMNYLFEIREESNTKHIVCGDFNIDIAGESDRKQNLIQNLHALGFELANNLKDFARFSQSSQSTIDLVFFLILQFKHMFIIRQRIILVSSLNQDQSIQRKTAKKRVSFLEIGKN